VPLTPEQFALVSGKNGATARQIADESGAKLELNKYVFLTINHAFKNLALLAHPRIDHPPSPTHRGNASSLECDNREKGVVTIKGKAGAVSAAQVRWPFHPTFFSLASTSHPPSCSHQAAVFELLDEDRDFHLRAAEEKKEQEALKAAAKAAAPPAPKPVATSVPAQKGKLSFHLPSRRALHRPRELFFMFELSDID
jgi:hypothetical protein